MLGKQYLEVNFFYRPLFVIFLFLLWNQILSLEIFSLKFGGIDYSMISVCFILILLNFYFLFFKRKYHLPKYYSKALIYIFFIVIIPIAVTSVISLNQPLTALLRRPMFFLGYLVMPYLVFIDLDDRDLYKLFDLFMIMTGLACVLVIFGSFLPEVRSWFSEGIVATRYERVRLGTQILPNLTKLLFFFSVVMSFRGATGRLRKTWVAIAFILFWMVAFVWGTRQVVLSFAVTLVFYWLISLRPVDKIRALVTVLLVFVFGYALIGADRGITESFEYLQLLFGSISEESSALSGSIGVRAAGVEYYYEQFVDSNYIGFGMISTTEGVNNPLYVGLKEFGYNLNDIGLLGMLFRFGFPVLFFLPIVFSRMLKDLNYVIRAKSAKAAIIAESFKLFLIAEIITFPFTKAFFFPKFALFYGLVMYFVWRLTLVAEEPASTGPVISNQNAQVVKS